MNPTTDPRCQFMKPLGSYRSDPYTSKMWILPDGSMISIPAYHYQWILANGPLVKAYGLEAEQLPPIEDPVRIAAIQKGFFRVNYVIRDGHLTVEGISTRFGPTIHDALRAILAENEGQIGNLTIHLFNDDVSGLVMQKTLPWYRYSNVEKAESLVGLVDSSRLGSDNTLVHGPLTGEINDP